MRGGVRQRFTTTESAPNRGADKRGGVRRRAPWCSRSTVRHEAVRRARRSGPSKAVTGTARRADTSGCGRLPGGCGGSGRCPNARRRVGVPLSWSAPSARAGSIPPAHAEASQVPEPCEPFGSRSPSHPLSWGVATTTRTEDHHHGASSPRRLRPRCSVRASPRLRPRNPYPRRRASGGGITWR